MEDIEDTDYVALEHDQLVSAISKLDKTQHITEPTRNEPTNLNSEFNLIKKKNKLNLNNVAKILENTSHHVQISKKLKKTQDESKVLSKPLEKPHAIRIKRATGYEETKKRVGRWDPVVARSRTIDYVTFPLKHVSTKLQPTGEFLSKFKNKSDLEKELEVLDPPDVEDNDEEEVKVFPMSYEDMVQHRQHIAKMRAQESYKAAKSKRQGKIKSKKYHRVLKKEKLKQQLKEFEELQKTDPEEALLKLEALEKGRALERHTLRHKSTGKWAKNKLIRAKYNKEVRQELSEQLAISRCLTTKNENNQSSDDEPETSADLNLVQDPMQPWMLQRSDKSNVNTEFDFGYKKFLQNKMKRNEDDDSEDSETEQSNVEKQVEKKLNKIRGNIEKLEMSRLENKKPKLKTTERDNIEYLKLKPTKVKAVIDEELIETASKNINGVTNESEIISVSKVLNGGQPPAPQPENSIIETDTHKTIKQKHLNTAIPQVDEMDYDHLDDHEEVEPTLKLNYVLEDDDLVDSFRQEKEDEKNKDKLEDVTGNLPGWGSWGGKGVKPQKRRKNRFIMSTAPKMPRRDENKGDIIIRENKDPKLVAHKVKDVPFPFVSVKDYEASIRAPLGNTFIPEKAHKKLIRPSIITKAGAIIEPMDEEELLVPKNRIFKNESVMKTLGCKGKKNKITIK